MARRTRLILLPLFLLAGLPHPAAAQPATAPVIAVAAPDEIQELRLHDGTTLVGRVTAVDGERLTFVTSGGATLAVNASEVASVRSVRGRAVDGAFWKDDPNPTRLFFGPTARPLEKGAVYLGVYELFLPFVQVGVTDRFSIGGGTPLVFGGGGGRPFWLTPKFTVVSRPRTQVAVGAMHIANVDGDSLGIAYGAVTQGSRDSAVTLGLGVAYARYENRSPPVVMLGVEHRVHRSVKLVSENYAFQGGGLVSGGVRFLSGRLSADLALAAPLGVDEVVVFPMVNFVWAFR